MKKVLGVLITGLVLASCSSNIDDEVAEVDNEAIEAEMLAESPQIDFGANELLEIYTEKQNTPLESGLYENRSVVDGNAVSMTVVVDADRITKTSLMRGFGKQLEASAKYTYSGNVIRYDDVKGDKFLFNPNGEAFIKTSDGFSFVEICDGQLQKIVPQANTEGVESDTYCEDGIMLSIFTKSTI